MKSSELRERIEGRLAGLRQPPPKSPLHKLETSNRRILENFVAVMVLSGRESEIPEMSGEPSSVLARTGIAREGDELHSLHAELTDRLDHEQRVALLEALEIR